jgi:hypothetical protein
LTGDISDKTPQDMIIDAIFSRNFSHLTATGYISSKLDPSRHEPFPELIGLLFTSRRAADGSWQVPLLFFPLSTADLTII